MSEIRPRLVCDDAVPMMEGRLEQFFNVDYLPGEQITRADLKDAKALIVRTRTRCDKSLLEGTDVSYVGTATIGMDHFNVPELTELNIYYTNAPGCNAPAVAQYVWSCLLRAGFDPARHTLGVVGKGNVGGIVVEWGRRLGANILVCDPPRKEKGLSDEDYLSLQELAQKVDAITFHTPLSHSGPHPSYHLADEKIINLLKPGTILVNAARGGVVDEIPLLKAMHSKNLTAIIDTWENETGINGHCGLNPDLLREAFIATPHIAGYSLQGKQRASRMILETLGSHFGFSPDTSGLEGPYTPPTVLTPQIIINSYNPAVEMAQLRKSPEDFERLRNTYPLRNETGL
ncbi:MAG: 4-phosphoerythronate dehydrogenase [Muribaculaceae bacterium]|nr:4-phosphoerythronate dehydrogenase [Muribaculaceae bacterium]